jgi:hypothetical protein
LGGSKLHAELAGFSDSKAVIGKTDFDFSKEYINQPSKDDVYNMLNENDLYILNKIIEKENYYLNEILQTK